MNITPLPRQHGGALIETLVAMLIVAFGALGFVGLQARTATLNLEGYQRAQALLLLKDIEQRMSVNRVNAAAYESALITPKDDVDCSLEATTAARDLCEWSALLKGAAEKTGTTSVGAITNAYACITALAPLEPNSYQISIVWQGVQKSAETATACAKSKFLDENQALRRSVSTVIRIGILL